MKTKTFFAIVLALTVMVFATSCGRYPGFKKTESGIYYKFYKQNKDSAKPKLDEVLSMNMRYHLKIAGKDSVMLNTAKMGRPFDIKLMKPNFKGDIFEALSMLHVGDSATFILNARDFFMKTAGYPMLPEGVDSTSVIYFDVKLLNSMSVEARQKMEMERMQKLKAQESGILQEYIKKNNITVQPTDSGVYVITKNPGSGRAVAKGLTVKMNLTIKSLDGVKLFSSLDQQSPTSFEYGNPSGQAGLDQVLGTLKAGSNVTVIAPSAQAFGAQGATDMKGNPIIKPFTPAVYDVQILAVQTKEEVEKERAAAEEKAKQDAAVAQMNEPSIIQKYLADNKITAKPTASGMYYIEQKKGHGAKAVPGAMVKVHYTGKLVNGKVFDSSVERKQPFEFMLGQGSVIPGWEEGIAMMNEGGKATFIIPSKLGYGASGSSPVIPPYSPLVFDVELVSVKINKK